MAKDVPLFIVVEPDNGRGAKQNARGILGGDDQLGAWRQLGFLQCLLHLFIRVYTIKIKTKKKKYIKC